MNQAINNAVGLGIVGFDVVLLFALTQLHARACDGVKLALAEERKTFSNNGHANPRRSTQAKEPNCHTGPS